MTCQVSAKDAQGEHIQNTHLAKKGQIKSNLFNFVSTLLDQLAYGRTSEKSQVSSVEQPFILVIPLIQKNKRDGNSEISNIRHRNKQVSIFRHKVSYPLQHDFRLQHVLEAIRKNDVVKSGPEYRHIHGLNVSKVCFMKESRCDKKIIFDNFLLFNLLVLFN